MTTVQDVRAIRLDSLALGVRVVNVLRKSGATTLGELSRLTARDLRASRCLGEHRVDELRAVLRTYGLSLRGDPGPSAIDPDASCEALGSRAFAWFSEFARDPRRHLVMPVWVLDLCPRTQGWLTSRQLRTVQELVDSTEDDLWLLALADDLPLADALGHLDEVKVRLGSFGLSLRASRPAVETFRLPAGRSIVLERYRVDEFRLRAETVFRLRLAHVSTLGDLARRSVDLEAECSSWPREPLAQVRALLALLDLNGCLDHASTSTRTLTSLTG
jgi:hypothetical protein